MKIKYQCFDCGCRYNLGQLKKRLLYTVNNKTDHFNYNCPACNGRKFIILLVVKRD